MQELDAALNELGMLSNVSSYRLEYLQDLEAASERRKASSSKSAAQLPQDSGDPQPDPLCRAKDALSPTISVNSQFVTSINIRRNHRLELEVRDRRLSDHQGPSFRRQSDQQGPSFRRQSDHQGPSFCSRRHSCPSGHICSFISPPRISSRSRIITIPGGSSLPYHYRPSLPLTSSLPVPGVLSTSRNRTKFRGRVRFRDPAWCLKEEARKEQQPLYPMDEELASRLASIKLTMGSGANTDGGEIGSGPTVSLQLSDEGGSGSSPLSSQQLCNEVNRLEISNERH